MCWHGNALFQICKIYMCLFLFQSSGPLASIPSAQDRRSETVPKSRKMHPAIPAPRPGPSAREIATPPPFVPEPLSVTNRTEASGTARNRTVSNRCPVHSCSRRQVGLQTPRLSQVGRAKRSIVIRSVEARLVISLSSHAKLHNEYCAEHRGLREHHTRFQSHLSSLVAN